MTDKQLIGIYGANGYTHFKNSNTKFLRCWIDLKTLASYCEENKIYYEAIFAQIGGGICRYAYEIKNQEDFAHALELSKTEGYFACICACKEDTEEFRRYYIEQCKRYEKKDTTEFRKFMEENN